MTKIKCKKCGTFLLKAAGDLDIEIKCRKCKQFNKFKERIVPFTLIYGKKIAVVK